MKGETRSFRGSGKKMYTGFGNAVVGQSGGPTAAINATLSGVIREAKRAVSAGKIGKLYGMKNGIQGFLSERMIDLTEAFADDERLLLLEDTPAAALGSCRFKMPKVTDDITVYEKLLAIFKKYDIRYFFYIGGNDSMDTVAKLSEYTASHEYEMAVIGVPKTIDNDVACTDHTPGFGSAAKYIALTMQEIIADCHVYTMPAVTVVETSGRDAGWLTAAAALPRALGGRAPDYVYLPERAFSEERFLGDVRAALKVHPDVVVVVSEGARFENGRYVGEGAQSGVTDAFGHKYLAGTGKVLGDMVKEKIGCKVRTMELNILQRCSAHVGSKTDIDESVAIGSAAVRAALSGVDGRMMTFVREYVDGAYHMTVSSDDARNVANQVKFVPDEYITPEGNQVTDACLAYMLPLIQGERQVAYKNGLPVHCILD